LVLVGLLTLRLPNAVIMLDTVNTTFLSFAPMRGMVYER